MPDTGIPIQAISNEDIIAAHRIGYAAPSEPTHARIDALEHRMRMAEAEIVRLNENFNALAALSVEQILEGKLT